MINILYGAVEVTATFLEFFLGIKLIGHLAGVREQSLLKCLAGSLVLMGVIQFINQYKLFTVAASFIAIFGMGMAVSLMYKKKIADTTVAAAAYVALIHMIDFLLMSVWGIVLGNEDFGAEVVRTYSDYRVYYIVSSKVLLISVYVVLVKKVIPSIRFTLRKMLTGVIVCLWLIWYFGSLSFDNAGVPILVIWVMVLLMGLAGLYIMSEYFTWKQAAVEYGLASEHNKLIAFSYEELKKTDETRRQLYHDMKNHYLAIRGYIEAGNQEKALAYMDKVGEALAPSLIRWTGIECLDMLLNYKVNAAAREGITITVKAELIELDLSEQEMIALLGNALDNAIEACRDVEGQNKWIRVLIRRMQDMTNIKISNPYASVVRDGKGNLVTTKADKTAHGLGIKGMQVIVENHGGVMNYGTEGQIFVLQISFFR